MSTGTRLVDEHGVAGDFHHLADCADCEHQVGGSVRACAHHHTHLFQLGESGFSATTA